MRFFAYVVLLFSIAVVFYFFGFGPLVTLGSQQDATGDGEPDFITLNCPADAGSGNVYNINATSECEGTFFSILAYVLAGGILGFIISFITGFSAMYIIPMIILYVVLNFFVFPFSFMFDMGMPTEFKLIIVVFFNMITVAALLNFIRGST